MSGAHKNCTVFITGAGGNVGSNTLHHLCTSYPDIHVVAGVHEFELSTETMKHWNVEQVRIEGNRPDELRAQLKQTDAKALFIIPPVEDRVQVAQGYVEAAKHTNVHFLLLLSSACVGKDGLALDAQYRLIEEAVVSSGLPHCILRCDFFMENHLADAPSIKRHSTFAYPVSPDAEFNPVAVDDVTRIAALVLADHGHHKGRTYALTGTRPLTMTHIAEHYSKLCGREIKFVECGEEEGVQAQLERGDPDWLARARVEAWGRVSDGGLRNTSGDVRHLLGEPAKSFADFLQLNRVVFI